MTREHPFASSRGLLVPGGRTGRSSRRLLTRCRELSNLCSSSSHWPSPWTDGVLGSRGPWEALGGRTSDPAACPWGQAGRPLCFSAPRRPVAVTSLSSRVASPSGPRHAEPRQWGWVRASRRPREPAAPQTRLEARPTSATPGSRSSGLGHRRAEAGLTNTLRRKKSRVIFLPLP